MKASYWKMLPAEHFGSDLEVYVRLRNIAIFFGDAVHSIDANFSDEYHRHLCLSAGFEQYVGA